MVDGRLRSLYDRVPRPVQNLGVSLKGWQLKRRRRGGAFEELLEEAMERAWADSDALDAYRERRLSVFMRSAAESPFWRARFDRYGVDPAAGDPFEELSKLPILSKQEVKQSSAPIRPDTQVSEDLLQCRTSGTTGSGLQFVQTKRALREQWAIWWRYRRWHGIELDTWHGYFGGIPVVPVDRSSPPLWRVNRPGRQVMYSSYHVRPGTANAYLDDIKRRALPWLHGYPSTLGLLANLIRDRELPRPSALRIVTIGAETLFEHQREAIEDALSVPVREHYGLEEAVANISECPEGRLHVDEDFAHVEFVPLEDGDEYRIVGTNWSNPAYPLLRYDTGDVATLADEGCACGRNGRIVKDILGRQDDYVLLPSGARVGRLDHIFKDFESVREAQIYQPERAAVVLRIVPGRGFDESVESELLEKARTRLGGQIEISIERVDEIPRTGGGKMKFVVSDLEGMRVDVA